MKKNAFNAIYIALGAFVLWLLYKLYKFSSLVVSGGAGQVDKDNLNEQSQTNLNNVSVNQNFLTRPATFYKQVADNLYNAMDYAGTDKDTVFDLVKNLNSHELQQVYKDFGYRINNFFNFLGLFSDGPTNLQQWFKSELSAFDYERMKIIWKYTNIAF